MNNFLLVFVGGGLGSCVRYGIMRFSATYWNPHFPNATLLSNTLSSILLGLIVGLTLDKSAVGLTTRLLLVTGFCGGFSTFSAFSFETFEFLRNGQTGTALLNIGYNVIACLLCVWAGLTVAK
jgi:CrcB protein